MRNHTEYNKEENTAISYKGQFSVATLNFNNDKFEALDEMSNDEAKEHYEAMSIEKNEIDNDNYSMKAEQGLYN